MAELTYTEQVAEARMRQNALTKSRNEQLHGALVTPPSSEVIEQLLRQEQAQGAELGRQEYQRNKAHSPNLLFKPIAMLDNLIRGRGKQDEYTKKHTAGLTRARELKAKEKLQRQEKNYQTIVNDQQFDIDTANRTRNTARLNTLDDRANTAAVTADTRAHDAGLLKSRRRREDDLANTTRIQGLSDNADKNSDAWLKRDQDRHNTLMDLNAENERKDFEYERARGDTLDDVKENRAYIDGVLQEKRGYDNKLLSEQRGLDIEQLVDARLYKEQQEEKGFNRGANLAFSEKEEQRAYDSWIANDEDGAMLNRRLRLLTEALPQFQDMEDDVFGTASGPYAGYLPPWSRNAQKVVQLESNEALNKLNTYKLTPVSDTDIRVLASTGISRYYDEDVNLETVESEIRLLRMGLAQQYEKSVRLKAKQNTARSGAMAMPSSISSVEEM